MLTNTSCDVIFIKNNVGVRNKHKELKEKLISLKRYKAYFRWLTREEKDDLRNHKALVLISVGEKYHEGAKFEATLKLINKSFQSCNILVADTLRSNILGLSNNQHERNDCVELAVENGREWLERNIQYIKTLSIPYVISTWENWRNKSDYSFYLQAVKNLYIQDSHFKSIVSEVVEKFLKRSQRNLEDRVLRNLSTEYILEESAVTCLWIKEGYKYDVYPSGDNLAMLEAYNKLLDSSKFLYKSLSLNIKKFS